METQVCQDAGGRIVLFNNKIIRYAQNDYPAYGSQVNAFEITKLTTVDYEEKKIDENPTLEGSGTGWNAKGMHNIDPHRVSDDMWIACVDGWCDSVVFGKEY